jgi:hypothetical protein
MKASFYKEVKLSTRFYAGINGPEIRLKGNELTL